MSPTTRIGMVLDAPYPPELPREKKEAKTLQQAGFDIHLLSAPIIGRPNIETFDYLTVHRANLPNSKIVTIFQRGIHHLINIHPGWYRALIRYIQDTDIRLLHVMDLTYAKTALAAARKLSLPIILDLHENYPAALDFWDPKRGFLKKYITRSYRRMVNLERVMCQNVDHVLTVVDEMKERLVQCHDIDPEKITVILNAETKDYCNNIEPLPDTYTHLFQGKFIVTYVGGFASHRGLEIAIEGMNHVVDASPDVLLVFVGGPKEYQDQLEKLAKQSNLQKNILFLGWQPPELLAAFINASDLGIIPHNSNEHTENTVPHKLFQYMTLNKPVLVSNCKPLARIVNDLRSGVIFEAGNPMSFAENLLKMRNNTNLRKELGKNGGEATRLGDWNWDEASRPLPEIYKTCIKAAQGALGVTG